MLGWLKSFFNKKKIEYPLMMRFSQLDPGEEFEKDNVRYIKNDGCSYQTITNIEEHRCIRWFLVTDDFMVRRCNDKILR